MVENIRQYILEMSTTAKDAKIEIMGLRRKLTTHIIRIYLSKLSENKNNLTHWSKEVANWLKDISRITLKPKDKKFKYETYFKMLYEEPLNNGDAWWVDTVNAEIREENIKVSVTPSQIYKIRDNIKKFMVDVCKKLVVSRSFTTDELKLLTDKHFVTKI